MYLAQLIQESQNQIASWEAEIAELQSKILAKQQDLQVYGSVQEAMKSADLQLINAIKMLDQVCPDELPGYQELITSRFNATNPNLIESGDNNTAENYDYAPPSSPRYDEVLAIKVTATQAKNDQPN